MSKKKFKAGDLIVTNAMFAKVIGNKKPISGTVLKETGWQADVWQVRLDGFAKPQRIHAGMMEKQK